MIASCPDIFAVNLPMAAIASRPISDIPLKELTEAALSEGVATAAEMKVKVRNVE